MTESTRIFSLRNKEEQIIPEEMHDLSKYNGAEVSLSRLTNLKELVEMFYFVEMFTRRKLNWAYRIRAAVVDKESWLVFKLACPICGSTIYYVNNGYASCKQNHASEITNLRVEYLYAKS